MRRQEFLPQRFIVEEHARITLLVIFDALSFTPRQCMQKWSASMTTARPSGFTISDQLIGQLDDGLFLDLRPRHDPLGDARILRQPDEVRVLVWHHAYPQPAHDRAQVMAAGAAHGDRPMIMSSLRCSALGNSVSLGSGT
jgi:hypothetical protein